MLLYEHRAELRQRVFFRNILLDPLHPPPHPFKGPPTGRNAHGLGGNGLKGRVAGGLCLRRVLYLC